MSARQQTLTDLSEMAIRVCKCISLDTADAISTKLVEECGRQGFNPVAVSVLDPSGDAIVTKRMDGTTATLLQFATAKANTAASLGMPSRSFRDKYTQGPVPKFTQCNSMVAIAGGKLAPFPGGILIRDKDGDVVGSVGVSGAAGDEDEYLAIAAVQQCEMLAGCVTEPAIHSCSTLKEEPKASLI